ncbi:hypothetical protein [Rhodopirellula sp. MGV]|uniref:hypothetical protein n=1 Tax=Rhodopirellula sp. MGV TaxID=2023130 RepID=UPI000B96B86B|nr:hypothetical protein [Rhodopirellula sp. MGV]OYP32977.1 hypothetical protein CGZ80_18950 [Rhodopirellula sp. MGV]PNY35365.1 hypothetical protein C2E31_17760 [Rhodopirellula baltica]
MTTNYGIRTRGELIRDRRVELGLSQQDLADAADVALTLIVDVESSVYTREFAALESVGNILGFQLDEMTSPGASVRPTEQAFASWPWSLSSYVQNHLLPDDLAYCRDKDDARASIEQMRDGWREHLRQCGEEVEEFQLADDLLNQERDRYVDRYVKLWQANDETLMHPIVDGQRVALTVVLPVTAKAYEAMRNGQISFMDIGPDDVLPESQHIVLDSAVEFSCDPPPATKKVANAISYSVFYQIAVLAKDPSADDFCMLAFAASGTNIQRLAAIGFIDHDVTMPNYGYQLCEFRADNKDLPNNIQERRESISFFAGMFRRWVAGDKTLRRKRRMILGTLSVFHKLVKPRRKGSRKRTRAS